MIVSSVVALFATVALAQVPAGHQFIAPGPNDGNGSLSAPHGAESPFVHLADFTCSTITLSWYEKVFA